jgi:hypothetical protein
VRYLIITLALATCAARLLLPAQPVGSANGELQAWGHLLAGGLVGAYLYDPHELAGRSRFYFYLGMGIGLFELAVYLVQRFLLK